MELNIKAYRITNKRECGCPTCGRVFTGLGAFDAHRVGKPRGGRKCAENMRERGLELTEKGTWRKMGRVVKDE